MPVADFVVAVLAHLAVLVSSPVDAAPLRQQAVGVEWAVVVLHSVSVTEVPVETGLGVVVVVPVPAVPPESVVAAL